MSSPTPIKPRAALETPKADLGGLAFLTDFVTARQEQLLVGCIDEDVPMPTNDNHRVWRFGPGVIAARYKSGIVRDEIPFLVEELIDRVIAAGIMDPDRRPDSVSIHDYRAGQFMGFHTDSLVAGDPVVIVGLLSDAEIAFRHESHVDTELVHAFPRRALLPLSGELRYAPWQHSIRPVTDRRVSIVLRHGENR